MKELPSQSYLQSRIDYNPETGEARWKPVDSSYGTNWKTFNSKFANKLLNTKVTLDGINFRAGHLIYKLVHNTDVTKIIYLDKDSNNLSISNLKNSLDNPAAKRNKIAPYKNIPSNCINLLKYNHHTGIFTWLPREHNSFNNRYAGKEAGYSNPNKYRAIRVDGSAYQAHRIAWFMYYGVDPGIYQIDHIDGNRSNNAIKNLRLANNSLNTSAASKNAKGYYEKEPGKFSSTLKISSKTVYLGTFDTPEEASQVYDLAIQKYKPTYSFTSEEQTVLGQLYNSYPNCDKNLQAQAHNLQVKALDYYSNAVKNS